MDDKRKQLIELTIDTVAHFVERWAERTEENGTLDSDLHCAFLYMIAAMRDIVKE